MKGSIEKITNMDFPRLCELAEADKDGRLVVLPCKTGDTIYQLRGKRHALGEGVSPRIISCAQVWADGDYELLHRGATPCTRRDFGKTWFLTRAEAEAAMKGAEHE